MVRSLQMSPLHQLFIVGQNDCAAFHHCTRHFAATSSQVISLGSYERYCNERKKYCSCSQRLTVNICRCLQATHIAAAENFVWLFCHWCFCIFSFPEEVTVQIGVESGQQIVFSTDVSHNNPHESW